MSPLLRLESNPQAGPGVILFTSLGHLDIHFPKNSISLKKISIFEDFGRAKLWKHAKYIEN